VTCNGLQQPGRWALALQTACVSERTTKLLVLSMNSMLNVRYFHKLQVLQTEVCLMQVYFMSQLHNRLCQIK